MGVHKWIAMHLNEAPHNIYKDTFSIGAAMQPLHTQNNNFFAFDDNKFKHNIHKCHKTLRIDKFL